MSQPTVSVQVDLRGGAAASGSGPVTCGARSARWSRALTVGSLYEQQAIFDVVVWGGPQTRAERRADGGHARAHASRARRCASATWRRSTSSPTPTVDRARRRPRAASTSSAEVRGRDAADVAADATARLRQMTFEHEYRAEVLGDAVERADDRVAASCWPAIAAGVMAFLLLQAAHQQLAGRRGAVRLRTARGERGAAGRPTSSAVPGSVPCWPRSSPWWSWRSASRSCCSGARRSCAGPTGRPTAADALRSAAREQAPAVVIAVLVTAALFVPAAVMGGGAGLEVLQPFAVALLGGLVTSTVVVLFLVPALVGGVRRTAPGARGRAGHARRRARGATATPAPTRSGTDPTATTTTRSEKEVQR